MRLRQNLMNYFAVNIRKPAVRAVVAEREFLVIDAEKVQHSGVKVVGRRGLFCGFP